MSVVLNETLEKSDTRINFICSDDKPFSTLELEREKDRNLILAYMGKPDDVIKLYKIKQFIGQIFKKCINEDYCDVEIDLNSYNGSICRYELVRLIAEAFYLSNYKFDKFLSKSKETVLLNINILLDSEGLDRVKEKLREGSILGINTCVSRDYINTPSSRLTPEKFAEDVRKMLSEHRIEVGIKTLNDIKNLNMRAFLEVTKGSVNNPVLMILRYRGDTDNENDITAVIGKGLTYDSGGLSLKSKKGMITMHHDMAGASDTVCAIKSIEELGLKVNITAVIPLCENMLSPVGYRPGDIIDTMDGKTVLIKSTDAEGRLIIADAITYALKYENAKKLIDIATLTGGAASSYGYLVSAVAITDEELRKSVFKASEKAGSLICEMPLIDEYLSYLRCEHADIANSSNGEGSSMINAALFIKEFTNNTPWLHIDIAGTGWTSKTDGIFSYGATGVGVSLIYYIMNK